MAASSLLTVNGRFKVNANTSAANLTIFSVDNMTYQHGYTGSSRGTSVLNLNGRLKVTANLTSSNTTVLSVDNLTYLHGYVGSTGGAATSSVVNLTGRMKITPNTSGANTTIFAADGVFIRHGYVGSSSSASLLEMNGRFRINANTTVAGNTTVWDMDGMQFNHGYIGSQSAPDTLTMTGRFVLNGNSTSGASDIMRVDANNLIYTRGYTGSATAPATVTLTGKLSANLVLGANGSNTEPAYTFIGNEDTGMYRVNSNILGFAAGGAEVCRMQTAGVRIVSGTGVFRSTDGTAAAPSFTFDGDTNNGMYLRATDSIGFSCNSVLSFYLTSAGVPVFPNLGVAAATAVHASGGGTLSYSSSSLRYKTDIRDITTERSLDIIKGLNPILYRANTAHERVNDRGDWSWYGFIAEEVAIVDPRLAVWAYRREDTIEGEADVPKPGAVQVPESVSYDRITVPLVKVVQQLLKDNEELKARLAALEAKV